MSIYTDSSFWRRFIIRSSIVLTIVLIFPCISFAQEADDGDDEEDEAATAAPQKTPEELWAEEKKEIDAFYKKQLSDKEKELRSKYKEPQAVEAIKILIRKRRVVAGLGSFKLLRLPGIEIDWSNYNAKCPKTKEVIVAEVEKKAAEVAIERIQPDDEKKAIIREADEKYKMAKPGERVSLVLRGGRGTNTVLDNVYFYGYDDERIRLGQRTIIREDLEEDDQAKFYKDVNIRARENYLRNNLGKVDVKVESMKSQEVYERMAPAFLENNYVPDITKPGANLRTSKPEFWIPKRNFVIRVMNKMIADEKKNFELYQLPDIMRKRGYILEGKEWITPAEKARREAPKTQENSEGGKDNNGPKPPSPAP